MRASTLIQVYDLSKRLIFSARCLLTLSLICLAPLIASGSEKKACTKLPIKYEQRKYKVRKIRIHTARDLFGSSSARIAELLKDAQFTLKENQFFAVTPYRESREFLKGNFPPPEYSPQRVRFFIVSSHLTSCDDVAKTLDVDYYVYSSDYAQYLSEIFEAPKSELTRAIVPTKLTRFLTATKPRPYISFDRMRGVFAGSKATIRLPDQLINEIQVNASGSSSSGEAHVEFQGSKDTPLAALEHMEWVAGYHYTNTPAVDDELQEARANAQWIGAAPLGNIGLILRYGIGVEGGNRQSDAAVPATIKEVIPSESYGAVKTAVGVTFRTERQEFAASYGLELGSVADGLHLDYVKNLFDVRHSITLLPWKHRPLTIDSHLSAGTLDERKPVPVATRFFGGNAENNFLNTDNWLIQSTPLIRSFSENQFVPRFQSSLGANKFMSFNLTVAPTVWGIPLVEKALSDNPEFKGGACIEFDSAEFFLFLQNVIDSKPAQELLEVFVTANRPNGDFESLDSALRSLQMKITEPTSLKKVTDAGDNLAKLREPIDLFSSGDATERDVLDAVLGIAAPGFLNALSQSLQELIVIPEASQPEYSAEFDVVKNQAAKVAELDRQKPCLYKCMLDDPKPYTCINNSSVPCDPACLAGLSPEAIREIQNLGRSKRAEANATIDSARAVFYRLVNELNRIAVSPLFMFDVAKIESNLSSPTSTRTKYALGSGLQFTIVSFNLRLGYSFNVHRQPSEPRGAFVFSLGVTDLLR
jgi:hypothetical protein